MTNIPLDPAQIELFNNQLAISRQFLNGTNGLWELAHYLADNTILKLGIHVGMKNNINVLKSQGSTKTKDFPDILAILIQVYPTLAQFQVDITTQHTNRNFYQHGEASLSLALRVEECRVYVNLLESVLKEIGILKKTSLQLQPVSDQSESQISGLIDKFRAWKEKLMPVAEYPAYEEQDQEYYPEYMFIHVIPDTVQPNLLDFKSKGQHMSLIQEYLWSYSPMYRSTKPNVTPARVTASYTYPDENFELYPDGQAFLRIFYASGNFWKNKNERLYCFTFDPFWDDPSKPKQKIDDPKFGFKITATEQSLYLRLSNLLFLYTPACKIPLSKAPTSNFSVTFIFTRLLFGEPTKQKHWGDGRWGGISGYYRHDEPDLVITKKINYEHLRADLKELCDEMRAYFSSD